MPRKSAVALTASQIALGSIAGLVLGGLCLFVGDLLIWKGLVGSRIQHGFWVGLFLLISFALSYGGAVVGVSEAVRFAGQRFGMTINRKRAYQGAFLGAPAIVALMTLLEIHWEGLVATNLLFYLLLVVGQVLASIVSFPLWLLLKIHCPPELLYVLAAPIGAILGYRLSSQTPPEQALQR